MKYIFALALFALLFIQIQGQSISTCTQGSDTECTDAYGSGYCCAYLKGSGIDGHYCARISDLEDEANQDSLEDGEEAYCDQGKVLMTSMAVAVAAVGALAF